MPYLDNLEIVAAEGYGYCAANCHRPAYSQRQEQQKRPQKCHKQVCSRALTQHQEFVDPLRAVSFGGCSNGRCGHASKHGIGPVRGVTGVSLVPLSHLMGHANVTGDIALVNYLSFKHFWHKAVAQRKEKHHNANGCGYLLHKGVIHFL